MNLSLGVRQWNELYRMEIATIVLGTLFGLGTFCKIHWLRKHHNGQQANVHAQDESHVVNTESIEENDGEGAKGRLSTVKGLVKSKSNIKNN